MSDIGEGAFESCIALTNVKIPSTVLNIKELTFYNCTNLESIELPVNINSIGSNAFTKCALENVEINNGTISKVAFSENSHLKTVKIGSGVTSIANDTFISCPNLQTITLGKDSTLTAPSNNWGATNATVTQEQ